MADRDKIISVIDRELASASFRDVSLNGLQVEGAAAVKKIVFGVSASLAFIKAAVRARADMAIVHHGLFWDKPYALRGPRREKIETLLKAGITLAAWHLPLDAHKTLGNNARILGWLNPAKPEPFGRYDGQTIGFKARLKKPLTLGKIQALLRDKLASKALTFNFGPETVRSVGVISGGAAGMFTQACEAGLDLYITGEPGETSQEMAREYGVNFMAAGHYNSEKAGVLALADFAARKFGVKTEFLDVPNPV